jgi:hypothetical protein
VVVRRRGGGQMVARRRRAPYRSAFMTYFRRSVTEVTIQVRAT